MIAELVTYLLILNIWTTSAVKAELIPDYSSEFKDFLEVRTKPAFPVSKQDKDCYDKILDPSFKLVDEGMFGNAWCPPISAHEGYIACGVGLKTEAYISGQYNIDNTAVNAIRFVFCHKKAWKDQYEQQLNDGFWGSWNNSDYGLIDNNRMCPENLYIRAISLYQQERQIKKEYNSGYPYDDVGVQGISITCADNKNIIIGFDKELKPYKVQYAKDINAIWTKNAEEQGKFVCGGQVKIDKPVGAGYDDTTLNGLGLKFCSLE